MNIRRCWLSLGLGVRIDNGLRRAIWRSLHSRRCLTLWAFSRRSPSFGVQRPGGSLRLLFPLVFRRTVVPVLCGEGGAGLSTCQVCADTICAQAAMKALRLTRLSFARVCGSCCALAISVWVITPSLFRSVALNFSAHSAPTAVVLCCAKAGMADNNTAVKMAVRTVLVSGWKAYQR
jgi:hypothetical protein